MIRAVIDTNVLFEGLTKRNSVSTLILRAWHAKLFSPCVSMALQYEYLDVLSRKLSKERWKRVEPAVNSLLLKAEKVSVNYLWRPISPDPGDDFIIDCAMNGRAWVVSYNIREFLLARVGLGLTMLPPIEFLKILVEEK